MKPILHLSLLLLTPLPGMAAVILEVEANNTKATAQSVTLMTGDSIRGNTTGSSTVTPGAASADYFRITIAGLTPGIYRHRLVITTTGTAGHTGTIRGLTQTAGVINAGTDPSFQTSSPSTTPPRFNQFYGFGDSAAELFYRVTGTASTTADYDVTLETEPVTPVSIGTFSAGSITLTSVGLTTADTELWVYDGSFAPMAGFGNDDASSTTSQSTLVRTYAPGTYYVAISNFNLANQLASPADDAFRGGIVLDGNFIANHNTTTGDSLDFSISDGTITSMVTNTKTGPYDINWFSFTVIPEPSSALLGIGGMLCLIARRKRS